MRLMREDGKPASLCDAWLAVFTGDYYEQGYYPALLKHWLN